MRNLFATSVVSLMLALPACAANTPAADTAPKAKAQSACPGAASMDTMRKQMGVMMKDMDTMMGTTTDPSLKARMQKMRAQMAEMHINMQKPCGMMEGGMMGKKMGGEEPASAESHHH